MAPSPTVAVALDYFSFEAAELPEVPPMDGLSTSMVLIALLAIAAPLAARFLDRVVKVPIVVFEIVLGIMLGPSLLGWIQPAQFTDTLADFGLAMLFFVAGNEIDFALIRGRPANRAAAGISLAAGMGAGLLLAPTPEAAVIIGVALCSTALGTLLPILATPENRNPRSVSRSPHWVRLGSSVPSLRSRCSLVAGSWARQQRYFSGLFS
ncbi:cation:proton antiporter [Pseudarthrobacter raffinosi]|uniref:cation:proton antiporter n=1 Tax=Pseudarthrobacter raffinosi TaxID=2953651 RepID=UPI0035AB878E